ncbi:hypothetical protein U9M48_015534 [Paspalum notatum var. saurae]|uniref:F-box domain-containing protein n=1 Tax=Paspalum notatum var. saurae TaxID=547442 RepID=A0AAQ3WM57_PASNO
MLANAVSRAAELRRSPRLLNLNCFQTYSVRPPRRHMEMESSRPGPAADLDRISGLPDELLVTILAGLRSAAAAARTSVLSHRWRRVWTKIPDLIFLDDSTPDTVDAAIAAYTAPVMERFAVGLEDLSRPVDAARAAAWLRFAASRAPREVHVLLPCKEPPTLPEEEEVEEELEVPVLESTLWLDASFVYDFRLRLPAAGAGSFAELRILSISFGRVSGADLSRVVTAQCPCLRVLELALLDVDGDISIRSDTLGRLALRAVGHENRLDVVAPNLEWLQVHGCNYVDARISAPILTEVEWDDGYDPARHRFIDTGRRLHRLAVTQWTQMPPLLERFDVADELSLHLTIPPLPGAYSIFLENTRKLPQSKVLTVGLKVMAHSIGSSLLHLLRKCGGITKLKIEFIHVDAPIVSLCKQFGCSCIQLEMLRTDNVTLDSLEELEFHSFTGSDEDIDLVKLLLMCKKTLEKMVINVADDLSLSEVVQKKIQSFLHPSTILEMGGPSSHQRDVCQCKDHDWY